MTVGQSWMSSITGEEKLHHQNASPRIIGGTPGTFLLRKEQRATSGLKTRSEIPEHKLKGKSVLYRQDTWWCHFNQVTKVNTSKGIDITEEGIITLGIPAPNF